MGRRPPAPGQSVDNIYVLAGHALKEVTAVYVLKSVEVKKTTTDDDDGDETETTEMSEPMQMKMTAGKDYRSRDSRHQRAPIPRAGVQ